VRDSLQTHSLLVRSERMVDYLDGYLDAPLGIQIFISFIHFRLQTLAEQDKKCRFYKDGFYVCVVSLFSVQSN
jgi:hypothetical protein